MVGIPSLKAVHVHLAATGYTAPYGSKIIEKSYKPAARSSAQSAQSFAMRLIGKQGHKASSYEQQSLIKVSWAHMPFRFCHAKVHMSQLLRIFTTIVCLHALKQT